MDFLSSLSSRDCVHDYLTHPLSFNLIEDEANYLLISVNASIKP